MNMKNFCIIALILVLLTFMTVMIGEIMPMHKQTIITDSNYVFIEEQTEEKDVQLTTNLQIQPQNNTKTQKTQIQPVENKVVNKQIKTIPQSIKSNNRQIKTTKTKPAPTQKTIIQKKTSETKTIKTTPKTVNTTQKKVEVVPQPKVETKQTVATQKPVPVAPTTTVVQPVQKNILTEQEEVIAWNKWRSDLQNQIMRDTKIMAPYGTGFRYSFTVDKYGNISNLKVWSTNSAYNELANRVIKPVIQSYQKKVILTFPNGTKRIITNVTDGFKLVSTSTKYTTAADYSDYETVKAYK